MIYYQNFKHTYNPNIVNIRKIIIDIYMKNLINYTYIGCLMIYIFLYFKI